MGPLLQRRLYGLQKGQGDVVAEAQRATPHVPAPLKADVPVLGDAEHMEKPLCQEADCRKENLGIISNS